MKFSRGVEALLASLRKTALDSERRAMVEELEPRRMLSVSADLTGDGRVDEGQAYTLGLSGSASGDTPTLDHWSIDWGDGSSPQTISGSDTTATHVYSDGSTSFQISAYLIASGTLTGGTYGTYEYATYATATASTTVAISDVPLSGSVWQVYTAYERNTLTLGRSYTDVAADPATKWIIDWGDGSGSSHGSHFGEEITGNPSQFKHVYASAGTYSLVATVFNKDQDGYTVSELSMVVNPLDYVVAIDDNGGIMSENEGTLDFTVRRTLPADQVETSPYSIYVHVKTSGIDDEIHNSADDTDYAVVMNDNIEDEGDGFYKITFDPNVDTATLSIIGTDDSDVETQEWFKVVITSVDASGHTPSVDEDHSQAFGGIDDDEQVVSIAIDDGLVSEDANTGRFVVSRGPDSSAELDVPITFTGAAVKGTDYTTSLSGGSSPYVHFDEDETQVTFSITAIDDATAEDPEDVVATLGTPGGDDLYTVDPWNASASAIISDVEPDAPQAPTDLIATPLSRSEVALAWNLPGGDGYPDGFVIQISTDDGATFVPYDQVLDPTARTFEVTGLDPETDYAFRVDAGIDDLDGNLLDDDDDIVTAGDDTAAATTTDDQWIDLDTITPDISTQDFTWFGESEVYPAGTYRILYDGGAYNLFDPNWMTAWYVYDGVNAGNSTLEVEGTLGGAVNQPTIEGAEHLSWGTFSSFVVSTDETIGVRFNEYTDPDLPGPGVTWKLQRMPLITITASNDLASEDGDKAEFKVDREGDANEALDVPIAFSGAAAFGDDYTTDLDGDDEPFVHFDAGESEAKFSLTPIEDAEGEDAEDVVATIVPPDGYGAGDPGSATATITDLPIVWITVPDNEMMEPDADDPGEFTVNRSSDIGELDVAYTLGGSADLGDDYTIDGDPEEQTVHFEEGVTSVGVTLNPCADNTVEDTETALPSLNTSQTGCATSGGLSLAAQAAMPVAGEIDEQDYNTHDDNYVDLDLQGVPDATEDSTGGYVPINADNDNGSEMTNNIPSRYDFQDEAYSGENDMVELTLAMPGGAEGANRGQVTLHWEYASGANATINVWDDIEKFNEVTNDTTFTLTGSVKTLYVEGVQVSKSLMDKITFTLTDVLEGEHSDTVVALVTPVMTELSAKANTSGAGAEKITAEPGLVDLLKSVSSAKTLVDEPAGTYKLSTNANLPNAEISGAKAVLLKAVALGNGVKGKLQGVQNIEYVNNLDLGNPVAGAPPQKFSAQKNLTTPYTLGFGYDIENNQNYFGDILLDTLPGSPFPFYPEEPSGPGAPGEMVWKGNDTPSAPAHSEDNDYIWPTKGKQTLVDYTINFWLYAAIQYDTHFPQTLADVVIYYVAKVAYSIHVHGMIDTNVHDGTPVAKMWKPYGDNKINGSSAFELINGALPTAYLPPDGNTAADFPGGAWNKYP